MAIQPIRLFGDPVLRTPAEPVVDFDKELRTLVKDLTDTMLDAPGRRPRRAADRRRPARLHLRRRRRPRPPDQPRARPVRRGAGRRRGLPVVPRPRLPDAARACASSPTASTCTASRSRSRAPSCWPAASSTRPTTSTASCSSTGSTASSASWRMKAIREAEWSGLRRAARQGQPARHLRPGALDVRARLRRHARAGPARRCEALLDAAPRRRRGRHPARRAGRPRPAAGRSPGRARSPRRARHRGAHAGRTRATRSSSRACAALAPDCCPVVAYGALVPRAALDIPRHGWVNLHFSLLPAWRGAAPVQHAILAGDEVTGATTFLLEEGLDTGPVFGVRHRDDPAHRHQRRPARPARGARRRAARRHPRRHRGRALVRRVPQPADGVSLAPKITRRRRAGSTGRRPRCAVDRLVRACTPAPGAWTTFRGERLKLGPVGSLTDADGARRPGELARRQGRESWSAPASHAVLLGDVQPAGQAADGRPRTGPAGLRLGAGRAARRMSRADGHRTAVRDPDAPRRAAFDVLRAVAGDDAYANLVLPGCCASAASSGRDAAFATELAYGTLRGQGTYDAVLGRLRRPAARRRSTPPVLDVLRLGAHQLLAMRVPDARRGRRDRRPGPGRASATGRREVRQRGAAPGRRARPRRLARRGGPGRRRRPGRPPGRRARPPRAGSSQRRR